MSIINNGLLLAAEAAAAGAYEISRSLRFNAPDSAFLSRTPASAGNRKTWTWAGWVKRGKLGISATLFASRPTSSPLAIFYFSDQDYLRFDTNSNSFGSFQTNAVFRDCSAWYHIVFAADSTQSTDTNRLKLYVNGVQQTFASATYPSQNTDGQINTATLHGIGAINPSTYTDYFDGYLADIHFIDGQALDPTSFGEFDTNGVWQPKAFSGGSYGTNGFRLTFSDNSGTTSTTLGKDAAGSNNWTPNNFSVAAGSGNDSLVDVPQNGDQVDTGIGGEVRGNYCTLNPIAGKLAASPTAATPFNGNLETSYDRSTSGAPWVVGTIAIPASGKWYWEYTITAASPSQPATSFGVISTDSNAANNFDGGGQTFRAVYNFNGNDYKEGGTYTTYASAAAVNDVIGIAVDMDAGTIYFHKNGSWANGSGSYNQTFSGAAAAFTDLVSAGKTWVPLIGANGGNSATTVANFGARSFAYTAPSGFKALCTTNLPTPTIADGSTAMDVKLYTGNGSTQTISGLGFSPDFVWVKKRNTTANHYLADTVRGATKALLSDVTDAEYTSANYITAFNSDGFSVGSDSGYNTSSHTYVAWTWDAGSSTVTNTSGSISSQVRAAPDKGFSVVTYTGSSSGSTVGHGLNVAPEFIFGKRRDGASEWSCYHKSLGNNQAIILNTTAAASNSSTWNYTTPTSTVVSLGAAFSVNYPSYTHVLYCFAPVANYSAFGSYTGNGISGDGPYIHLGFRPRFFMHKRTDSSGDWRIWDAARNTYNVIDTMLVPNSSGADYTASAVNMDFLSNGVKVRATDTTNNNASGATYVWAAFAEHPFQTARAR